MGPTGDVLGDGGAVHDLLDQGAALDQVPRVLGADLALGLGLQCGEGDAGDMALIGVHPDGQALYADRAIFAGRRRGSGSPRAASPGRCPGRPWRWPSHGRSFRENPGPARVRSSRRLRRQPRRPSRPDCSTASLSRAVPAVSAKWSATSLLACASCARAPTLGAHNITAEFAIGASVTCGATAAVHPGLPAFAGFAAGG